MRNHEGTWSTISSPGVVRLAQSPKRNKTPFLAITFTDTPAGQRKNTGHTTIVGMFRPCKEGSHHAGRSRAGVYSEGRIWSAPGTNIEPCGVYTRPSDHSKEIPLRDREPRT